MKIELTKAQAKHLQWILSKNAEENQEQSWWNDVSSSGLAMAKGAKVAQSASQYS